MNACTCPQGGWFSIYPPPPCPIHEPDEYRAAVETPPHPSLRDRIKAAMG